MRSFIFYVDDDDDLQVLVGQAVAQALLDLAEHVALPVMNQIQRLEAESLPLRERAAELRLMARKAIDANLGRADELEAA